MICIAEFFDITKYCKGGYLHRGFSTCFPMSNIVHGGGGGGYVVTEYNICISYQLFITIRAGKFMHLLHDRVIGINFHHA